MDKLIDFLNQLPWFAWVAIVGIAGGTVVQLVRLSHRHDERMAMIKQGMDPSSIPVDDEK